MATALAALETETWELEEDASFMARNDGRKPYVPPTPPEENYPLALPQDAMYGVLADIPRRIGAPRGWAYGAALTLFAAQGINLTDSVFGSVRPTLYTCLMGSPGRGKSRVTSRLGALLSLATTVLKKQTPGSDRGLFEILGASKKDIPELTSVCLLQDELRNLLRKGQIQGSTLNQTLCTLFYEDEAGCADKKGVLTVNVRLSLLGLLAVESPSEFSELFGSESQAGLFSRFILVPEPPTWDWDDKWIPDETPLRISANTRTRIPDWCWDRLKEWRAEGDGKDRGRLGEIAMRVALISACANGDALITVECLEAALRFGEWQESVRQAYKAGVAETLEARCTSAIIDALEAAGVDEDTKLPNWVKIRPIRQAKNWDKKIGVPLLHRVLAAMRSPGGPIIGQYRKRLTSEGQEVDDYNRPTGTYRLKGATDED
jgi:hypothetical protein